MRCFAWLFRRPRSVSQGITARAVDYIKRLARRNPAYRSQFDVIACLLIDLAEDNQFLRMELIAMRTATENANVVLTKLKDTQTALDTATAALTDATKLAKTQDETDALKLVADAAETISPTPA